MGFWRIALIVTLIPLLMGTLGCKKSSEDPTPVEVALLQTFNANVSGSVDFRFNGQSHVSSLNQQINLGSTTAPISADIVVSPDGFPARTYRNVSIHGTQTRSGVFEKFDIPLWLQEMGTGNPTWNYNKIVLVWETRKISGTNYVIPENFRKAFRDWVAEYCSGNPLVSSFSEREGNDTPGVGNLISEIRIFPDDNPGITNAVIANGGGVGSGELLVNYLFTGSAYNMIDNELCDLLSGEKNQAGGNIPVSNIKHGARIWAENWQGFEMKADGEYLNGYPGTVSSGNLVYLQSEQPSSETALFLPQKSL